MQTQRQQSQDSNKSLTLLNKYKEHLNNNKPNQHTEILLHERIVYLTAKSVQNSTNNLSNNQKSSQLLNELTTFINKVNVKVMSTSLQQMNFEQKLNLISKSIDMLFYKLIINTIKPLEKLLQLRALTFNNLSCLYKQSKQYQDALKSLEVTLQIQQTLLSKNYQDTYKSIASTYINKSVILSSMNLHKQAIETIKMSICNIENYRGKFVNGMKEKEQHQIKHMTLLAYFNIAVQYEHLENNDLAIKFYSMALKLAKELSNTDVKSQSLSALKKLKAKK